MDVTKIDNDFTDDEVERINKFVQNGCIGLETLVKNEHKVNSLYALYMAGKTYTEISKVSRVKKDLVLYMSAKMRWYEKRMEYLDDIQRNISKELANTQIEGLNFISGLISMHHKYYGDKINEYLTTGDETIIENLDLKQLTHYFKSMDMLEKLLNPANVSRKGSSVNVNINTTGAEVKNVDENTIEVKPGNTASILKSLAELKDKKKSEDE